MLFRSCPLAPDARFTPRSKLLARLRPPKAVAGFLTVHPNVPLAPTVNWHLEPRCNYTCKFCFATFNDVDEDDVVKEASSLMKVPRLLADAGASKINFVGGEPFLHPLIIQLIMEAKRCGLTTSVVTNGSRLTAAKLLQLKGHLDWLAFSIDASTDDIHAQMGRGVSAATGIWPHRHGLTAKKDHTSHTTRKTHQHLEHILQLWPMATELGYRMKVNTVVCKANLQDDMVHLMQQLKPERWKIFQVLPVEGQNTGTVDDLLITRKEFEAWCARHRAVEDFGVPFVPEDNNSMKGTYAMMDGRCRFYTNKRGLHEYGPSIFNADGSVADGGVEAAWLAVAAEARGFDLSRFGDRGGLYDWGQGRDALQEQLEMIQAASVAR